MLKQYRLDEDLLIEKSYYKVHLLPIVLRNALWQLKQLLAQKIKPGRNLAHFTDFFFPFQIHMLC